MTARRLLAIDTATERCAVALSIGERVIEHSERVGQGHTEHLLPMAQQLLAAHGVTLAQLEGIAFGAGPGSFTGLRIACGVAQGLAYGLDLPVLPVGNLAALALNAAAEAPQAQRIAAAVDARMSEVYWAVYEVSGDQLVEVVAPSLCAAERLPLELASYAPDTLAGEAWQVFATALDAVPAARRLPGVAASAAAILRLARQSLAAGGGVRAADAAPIYVRDRVAQTIDERRRSREGAAA